jgi:hypothetical protein
MVHGGSHILFSRKDVRPEQTRILLKMGCLPVSLDHRLCPESRLAEGAMVDVCDALAWARYKLPSLYLGDNRLRPNGRKVIAVGWSSGGQLAMSLAWTAPQRGLEPPSAILAFYCPTNYEDKCRNETSSDHGMLQVLREYIGWQSPIQPLGAEDCGEEYDVLAAVQEKPVSEYMINHPKNFTNPNIRSLQTTVGLLHGSLLRIPEFAQTHAVDWCST